MKKDPTKVSIGQKILLYMGAFIFVASKFMIRQPLNQQNSADLLLPVTDLVDCTIKRPFAKTLASASVLSIERLKNFCNIFINSEVQTNIKQFQGKIYFKIDN